MKTWLRAAGLALCCLLAPITRGQDAVRSQDVDIDVTDMKVEAVKYNDSYPDVRGVQAGGKKEYIRITVDYKVVIENLSRQRKNPGGLYVNDVDFEWTVIVSDETRIGRISEKEVIRLKRSVRYIDLRVEEDKDRDKVAVIYVDPRLVERFASKVKDENVFYSLTIKCGGRTIETAWGQGDKWGRKDSERNEFIPRNSSNKDLFSSEEVVERKQGLLTRHQTPWLFFSEDNRYEAISDETQDRR